MTLWPYVEVIVKKQLLFDLKNPKQTKPVQCQNKTQPFSTVLFCLSNIFKPPFFFPSCSPVFFLCLPTGLKDLKNQDICHHLCGSSLVSWFKTQPGICFEDGKQATFFVLRKQNFSTQSGTLQHCCVHFVEES